jgi:hypothetical protein
MGSGRHQPVASVIPHARARLLHRLVELLDAVLAQWAAYEVDRALAPAERAGGLLPAFGRASCRALREYDAPALARIR